MKNLMALLGMTLMIFGCAGKKQSLETVTYVDLERYLGKWYEIASYVMHVMCYGCYGTYISL